MYGAKETIYLQWTALYTHCMNKITNKGSRRAICCLKKSWEKLLIIIMVAFYVVLRNLDTYVCTCCCCLSIELRKNADWRLFLFSSPLRYRFRFQSGQQRRHLPIHELQIEFVCHFYWGHTHCVQWQLKSFSSSLARFRGFMKNAKVHVGCKSHSLSWVLFNDKEKSEFGSREQLRNLYTFFFWLS
jgi:hypothetical protein